MTSIANFFKDIQNNHDSLEEFIKSKNPTTQAELDHWMQVWDYESRAKVRNMY
jgi:hypothetical protein